MLNAGTVFSGHRISDIEYIRIKNFGANYRTQSIERKKGGLFGGTYMEPHMINVQRKRLDSVTLKVNDQVVYRRDGINFVFGHTGMADPGSIQGQANNGFTFEANDITTNSEYVKLMMRSDCRTP